MRFTSRSIVLAPCLIALATVLVGPAPTAEIAKTRSAAWPCWRGPTQDGHASDRTVPLEWSRAKNLKWQIDLPGTGNSSPVVWGNRVFVTTAVEGSVVPGACVLLSFVRSA